MKNVFDISKEIGIDDIIPYGYDKAKIDYNYLQKIKNDKYTGELLLVTSVNPTISGEGKTTVSIGLADYLNQIEKTILCLREPSLGPVFGSKGGAVGGGYNKIIPSDDINLHFTGDIHAITCANNLIASLIHNAICQKEIDISTKSVTFNRCLDINDKSLRKIVYGLSDGSKNVMGDDSFCITAACEIMSVITFSKDYDELRKNIDNIVFAKEGKRFFRISELGITDAVLSLLKYTILPNIVQTKRGTPTFVHSGPFANISVGTCSVISMQTALKKSKHVIVECGFGSDLGAEKFFNVVAKKNNLIPNKVVLVATVKALKLNGFATNLDVQNLDALSKGFLNLQRHIKIIESFGIKPILAINRFENDTKAEIDMLKNLCKNYECCVVSPTKKDENGFLQLAKLVKESKSYQDFEQTYDDADDVMTKIKKISQKIYGASEVLYEKGVKTKIKNIQDEFSNLKICISKTQYSLSDNKNLLGSPQNFSITISDVKLLGSINLLVVFLGDMMSMPGYTKSPLAKKYCFDNGDISINNY